MFQIFECLCRGLTILGDVLRHIKTSQLVFSSQLTAVATGGCILTYASGYIDMSCEDRELSM